MLDAERNQVIRKILRYLIEHPDVQDTLEGIVQWWILEERLKDSLDNVRQTMLVLEEMEFVMSHQAGDGRVHYMLNREKLAEILTWLGKDNQNS